MPDATLDQQTIDLVQQSWKKINPVKTGVLLFSK
jgi:hypothetical protein